MTWKNTKMEKITLPKENKIIHFNKESNEYEIKLSYSQLESFEDCPVKWYRNYVLGEKDPVKSEALDYGKAIHKVLEDFIDSKFTLNPMALVNIYMQQLAEYDIKFESEESREKCNLQALSMITRMYNLKNREDDELSLFEKMFFKGESETEVPFALKYDLPNPVEISWTDKNTNLRATQVFKSVVFGGFIDHVISHNGCYIINDHKTSSKLFKEDKLNNNLQFPIYAMVCLRKYGKLPKHCFYNFTRTGEYQSVDVTMARITSNVIPKINGILNSMFSGLELKENPSPLCYWCEFGFHHKNICKESSKYKRKK